MNRIKKYWHSIYSRLFKKSYNKYLWLSIEEMPVFNWFKIHATNNLTYLRKEPLGTFEYDDELEKHWFKLYDEFLDAYGVNEEFEKLLKLKRKHIKSLSDFVTKDDAFQLTESEMIQQEMEELFMDKDSLSDEETIIIIEKSLGFKINARSISVVEYYNYLEYIKKQSKSISNGKG